MAAIAAVAAASKAEAEAIEAAIFDFAESIDLDDEDVAKEVDEAGDGNVDIGGDINDGDDQGDGNVNGNGGGLAWERVVTKKRKSEMSGDEMLIHFDLQLKGMGSCPNRRCNCVDVLANGPIPATVARYLCWFNVKTK